MSFQELWSPLLAALLTSGTLVGIWKFIIEKYVDSFFKKREQAEEDIRNLQSSEFKAQIDKELAALKLSFDKHLATFRHRHSVFCTHQLEAFAQMFDYLHTANGCIYDVRYNINDEALHTKLQAERIRAWQYYWSKYVYFPDEVCALIWFDDKDVEKGLLKMIWRSEELCRDIREHSRDESSREYKELLRLKEDIKKSLIALRVKIRTFYTSQSTAAATATTQSELAAE